MGEIWYGLLLKKEIYIIIFVIIIKGNIGFHQCSPTVWEMLKVVWSGAN